MTISTALRMGSGFLAFVVIARFIGAEQFGLLSYWMAIAGLMALPVNYGFGMQLLREVGGNREIAPIVMTETVVAKFALSALVFLVAGIACLVLAIPVAVFLLILLMFVLESFAEHMNFLLRANAEFNIEAKITAISSLISVLMLMGAAIATKSLIAVCLAYVISRLCALGLGLWAVRRFWRFSLVQVCQSVKAIPRVLARGFSYATDVAVGAVNSTLDTILVGSILGTRAVGVYQSGMKLFQGFTSLAPIVSFVYLPELAAAKNAKDLLRLRLQANAMMRKLVLVGGVGAIALCLAPTRLVGLLYGHQYEELAGLLPWFALALLLRFMTAAFGVVLTALGLQAKRALVNAGSVAVLAVGIFLLAAPLGLKGVLVALSLAAFFAFSAYSLLIYRQRIGVGFGAANGLLATPVFALILYRMIFP
ncbi:MAG: oligosaccharide flippase family protein [Burkholderiaceae bacterium]|nr:oligosaccharide flippase family protein [Burkholderiaceae bacterium]